MSFGIRAASLRIMLLSGAGSLLFGVPSATAADSVLAGRWTGVVVQTGGSSYVAVMEFDRADHGRSDYPSLNCSAKLSGSGAKGVYQFRETITGSGRVGGGEGRCIDGTIKLSVSGDRMNWTWTGAWKGQPITASGTLTREAGSNQ